MTAFDGMREDWEARPLRAERLSLVQLPTEAVKRAVKRAYRRRDLGLSLAIAAAVIVVDLVLWSLLDLALEAPVLGDQGIWIIAAESTGGGMGAWMALRWRRPS